MHATMSPRDIFNRLPFVRRRPASKVSGKYIPVEKAKGDKAQREADERLRQREQKAREERAELDRLQMEQDERTKKRKKPGTDSSANENPKKNNDGEQDEDHSDSSDESDESHEGDKDQKGKDGKEKRTKRNGKKNGKKEGNRTAANDTEAVNSKKKKIAG